MSRKSNEETEKIKTEYHLLIFRIILFFIVGSGFIIAITVGLIVDNVTKKYQVQTIGTIVDIQHTTNSTEREKGITFYDVYVDYEIDGTEYNHIRYTEYNVLMKKGDKVLVIVDSRKPHVILQGNPLTPIIFAVLGYTIGSVLLIIATISTFKIRKFKTLLNNAKKEV